MVSKKLEKHLNSLNVKGALIMPKSDIHPKWYPDAKVIMEWVQLIQPHQKIQKKRKILKNRIFKNRAIF